MTTQAQVKKLVKPLLERHSDLALVGHLIVVKPLRHVLRAIIIDRTSNAAYFRPAWFVDHLLEDHHAFHITWGSRVYGAKRVNWTFSNAGVGDDLLEAAERGLLPILRAISNLESLYTIAAAGAGGCPPFGEGAGAVVMSIALGNLDAARRLVPSVRERFSIGSPVEISRVNPHFVFDTPSYFDWFNRLCRLLDQDDRDGMARMLHDWEAATIGNLKMKHLWEPTPFPLEVH